MFTQEITKLTPYSVCAAPYVVGVWLWIPFIFHVNDACELSANGGNGYGQSAMLADWTWACGGTVAGGGGGASGMATTSGGAAQGLG